MAILITGGAGFIGSHLAVSLLQKGESVVIVDNFNDYYNPQFKEQNISSAIKNKNCTLYRADITDYTAMERIFSLEKIEKIAHIAARAGVRSSIANPCLYADVNIKGTINLLELARLNNVKSFVFASSSSVYGKNSKIPFSEEYNCNSPLSPYAATKKAGEDLCYVYYNSYNLNVNCLRFFTVYGPRGRPDMAPYKFTEQILNNQEIQMFGDGTTRRDYTYVSDIISGIQAALDKQFGFEIFNLGNSKPIALLDLIKVIEVACEKKAKIRHLPSAAEEVHTTFADITKAGDMLDYKPKTEIAEGIEQFVEWYKQKRMH